ncbi:MAG: type II CAAX endopeptidase family protein [Calditrichota bacterium]
MKTLFYNSEENRPRAGWRIAGFVALFWCMSATIFFVKPLLGDITKREFMRDYSLLIVAILALAATIVVPFARRFFDKRSFFSLGMQRSSVSTRDLLFGFLLSAFMAGLFLVLTLLNGNVEVDGISWSSATVEGFNFVSFMGTMSLAVFLLLLLEMIFVGYWEELVFRGYLLQNMTDGMGLKIAVVVSCLLYGLIHSANPNAGILSSTIIVLFGFLRIYGYLATNMLWLSIGMHIGWNFFQGPVFGFAASGHQHATLLNVSSTGPDWLSGGSFGPEGSILMIPIVLLALWVMQWWSRSGIRSGSEFSDASVASLQ